MANTFRLKRSAVQNKVPTTGDLQLGELALNTFDGKLYTKKDNGTASIVEIGASGVSSFSAGSTGLTPSTATTGAITLAGTLAVANGGTGVTTSTGSGSNVLSTSPTLVTPLLGTPTSGTLTNCTGYTFANIASKPTTLSGYGITDALALSGGSVTGQAWFGYGNTSINGYSWVGAALTTNSIEIVNNNGIVTNSSPTLAFHRYGTGGPQFRLDATGTNILYLESAQANSARSTAAGGTTYFASLRLTSSDTNGIYVNGNSVLHAGNYNSYSPTLTGTGASGSWGISITGNAATVSSITSTQVTTGLGYTPNRIDFSRFAGDLNTLGVSNATSGVFNIGTGYTNGPASNLYGTLQAYWNTDIGVQFWQSYNGDSYWRKSVGSTFSGAAWRTYLDSSNYTSYSPSLTGSGASGTWGINISGNAATATAATSAGNITGGNLTGDYQVTSGIGVRFGHANQTDSNDGFISAGRFSSGLNIVGTQTTGGTGRQVRIWGSLIDDGGTAYVRNTGTWGISITGSSASCTGNAATATNLSNGGTVTLATATESNAISITQPGYTTDQPVKLLNFDWYGNLFSLGNIRSGSTPTNGFGVYYTASGGSRTEIARFGTGGSFNAVGAITQNGSQVLHASNYTSYAPSLTGSGASGTWGINVTGSAGSVAFSNVTSKPTTLSGYGITDAAPLASPALTGTPTAPTAAAGTNTTQIATTAFVTAATDAARQGLSVKLSCRAATTANITLSGAQTIDGVSVVAGDRVLVKNQTTGSQNGIYVAAAAAWSRATDFDADADVVDGAFTFVEEGTVNADSGWVLTTDGAIVVGTTGLNFVQFSGAGQLTAGAGLTKNGNTIDVVGTAGRIVANADSIDLATAGSSGTYRSVTTDAYGRVTAGTNPTTFSGYAISDTSANLAAAITDETGSGSLVFATSPTLVTPALGTPTSGTLTNCTGYTFANLASKPTTLGGYGITDALALSGGTLTGRTFVSVNGRTTDYTGSNFEVYTSDNTPPGVSFHRGGYSATLLYESDGELFVNAWTTRAQSGKLLSSGNYNSYSPTLTGTGASGTWGISITGTATTANNLNGFTNSNSSNPIVGADALTNNGVGYVNTVSLLGVGDGALYGQAYNSSWVHQVFGDYRTGQIAVRGKNNGTWQAWRTVLDSSNYNSYAATSTHTHGNITNAGAIGSTANLPVITTTSGVLTTGSFGTTANTFCQGNDSRLSDTRNTTNSVTFNNVGAGAASGSTFNGSSALLVSYNTIGAPSTTGSGASGTWSININGTAAAASNVSLAAGTATLNYVAFSEAATGNNPLKTHTNLTYNVSTNTLGASITGTAGAAAVLTTSRTINGTSFNGSANITTASWGTARTLTIGSTGKSVDGSAAVTWTADEMGVARAGAAGAIVETAKTINSNYTLTANYNGMSAGPITIAAGVTVTVPSGASWAIV